MKKLFYLLLFITITLFAAENSTLEKVSLQLHWKYQFEFAGFIAAKEKGFYKDVGLDVTLKEYQDGMDIEDEVLSGRTNYAIYNSLAFLDYLRGKPLVLLSSYFKRAALVLVTKPNIKSPKDLVGKTIMAATADDFARNFGLYFRGYGVSMDSLHLVPHSYNVDDFINGKVDAMTAFISNELFKLDAKGVKYNILDPSDDNLYILQMELITSKNEILQHPQRAKAFRDASIKGWQYALTHKDELVDIIAKKYAKHISREALRKEALGVQRLILPYTYEIGSIDRNFLKKQMEMFAREYHIKKIRPLDGYIFSPQTINFSVKEQKYIQQHKNISVCINYELFPIVGIKHSKITGEMADIFSLISKRSNLNFMPIKSDSEKDFIQKANKKQCDVVAMIAPFSKSFPTLKATSVVSATNFTLLSKLDHSFSNDAEMLKGKRLLVQKQAFKEYLNYLYPYLSIEVVGNRSKMVQDVLHDKAYAIVTLDEQADYLIDKYGYGKLKIIGFLAKEKPIAGSIGVQKDEPLLFSIIQKTLNTISQDKIESIRNSWRISRYQTRTDYTLAINILLLMGIILLIMIYYQRKLKNFNKKLEQEVVKKTSELREINESLEATVQEKIDELIKKDEILTLQSKQAVMGEMISMIAHQWRQPLNTITLQISNLQLKEMLDENGVGKEELLNILDEISHTIVYLSNTIDDFKTYFHPNKELSKVLIIEIIEKSASFIEARLKAKGIELKIKGRIETEVSVYANELIQVMLNILNNAIDAYENSTKEEKRITISVEAKNDEKLSIIIADEAGGIANEHIKQIFEPYFSTKGKNGTGLGLYMSKMIIEKQFRGDIKVLSKDGETRFIIEIPKHVRS
jgi:signal transduction histidine kinase/ABC-type nitrate/sulfonate/bicarbonate transport system substrate-binding protein